MVPTEPWTRARARRSAPDDPWGSPKPAEEEEEEEEERQRERERETERERAADVIAGFQGLDGIPAFGDQILSCAYYTTSADISRQKPFIPFLLSNS